jgi:ferrous iron transport protein A
MPALKSLNELRPQETGVVHHIAGGQGLLHRLDALGIRTGKRVTKISSMLLRGPVTVQVDRATLAIGSGMAAKILIEVDDPK